MKYRKLSALLLAAAMLAGCASESTLQKEAKTDAAAVENTEGASGTEKDSADTASAEETKDDDIDIDGKSVTGTSVNLSDFSEPAKITSGGTYTLKGEGEMVIVDAAKQNVTLILDNVSLRNDTMPPLYIKKAASVTIQLQGNNSLTMGSSPAYESLDAALYSKADLVMEGDGSLTVDSGYEHGIKAKDTAVFNGGTYSITAENDGIHVNETAEFKNGVYTIDARGEGIEAKDTMTIDDGTYKIQAADDAINAINALTINGGTITAVSSGNDAVDSNGDMIINGGDITAIGLKSPETAFDVDNTAFEIHGGKVLGLGSNGCYPTAADQPVLMVGSLGSEPVTSIELKNGESSVVSWNVSADQMQVPGAILLSDSALKQGSTYDLYVNGQKITETTLSDSITTVGNVQTMGGGKGGPGFEGQPPMEGTDGSQRPEDGQMPPELPEGMKGQRQKPGRRTEQESSQTDEASGS